jgi:hypothetical protein
LTVFAQAFAQTLSALMPLACALALAVGVLGGAHAQGIFTCVDGKGRKITADRSIADCADREQQELSRSGLLLRKVQPAPTAQELAAQEARDKAEAATQARLQDDKRRERALLLRYPNVAVHNRERNAALTMVDDIIASSNKRSLDLTAERAAIARELEFYAKNPAKVPFALKNRTETNEASIRAQQAFVTTQTLEKQRINERFDAELKTLEPLWARNLVPR